MKAFKKIANSKFGKYHIRETEFITESRRIPEHIKAPSWANEGLSAEFNSDSIQIIRTEDELRKIRSAGRAAAEVLRKAVELSQAVPSGHDLDVSLFDFIVANKWYPSCVGYCGFPKTLCVSQNDILVHGVPSKTPFRQGDFANLDVTVFTDGFFGDTSTMVCFGNVEPEIRRLVLSSDELHSELSGGGDRRVQGRPALVGDREGHQVP